MSMAVTVRIPTQLRELSGGASEVSADGGTVAEVLEELETAHPGFARAALRRAGRAAPLRERVRRRRGHPLPRRREHRRDRRPDRQHRPRRRRRLTRATTTPASASERQLAVDESNGVEDSELRANWRRRAERVARQERAAAAQVPCAAASDESSRHDPHELGDVLRGRVCSPASLVDAARRRGRCSTTTALEPGMSFAPGEEHDRVVVDLDLLADAADDDGAGLRLRERRRRAGPRPCGWNPGIGLPCGHVAGSPRSSTSFSSTSAEIACSQRSASLCTFSHSSPMTSTSRRSARRWRRTIEVGDLATLRR